MSPIAIATLLAPSPSSRLTPALAPALTLRLRFLLSVDGIQRGQGGLMDAVRLDGHWHDQPNIERRFLPLLYR